MGSLKKERLFHKRQYRLALNNLLDVLKGELEYFDDETFEPSSSVDAAAYKVIQKSNALKAILDVDE